MSKVDKALEEILTNDEPLKKLHGVIERTRPDTASLDTWIDVVYSCWLDHYTTARQYAMSPENAEKFAYRASVQYIFDHGKMQ